MKAGIHNLLRRGIRFQLFLVFFWATAGMLFSIPVGEASVTDGVRRVELENGLTVILKQDRSAPVASVQVWVRTGSANETEEEAGITHFIEHMIFKGTPTRKTGEIARTIESSGGHINAYTSLDRTVYYVEIDSARLDTAIDVLLDAIQNSLFEDVEIEREKEVVLEEYRRSLDLPSRRLNWAMMELSYQEHPYRRPVLGYESTIRAYSREAILNYVDKWYTPENMVLVAVGDFDLDVALQSVKKYGEAFPKRTGKEPARTPEPEQTALRKRILREEVQQAYLSMAWHTPSLHHENIPALDLLEIVLGEGKSSRLYGRLRLKNDLVHSVGASAYALQDSGMFSVDATLTPENLGTSLAAIVEEIRSLKDVRVSTEELNRAKRIAESSFLFSMETMSGQARTLAFFETMAGDMYRSDRYLEQLKKVTPAEVQGVARAYLRPENLSLGLMTPAASEIDLTKEQILALFTGSSEAATSLEKGTDPSVLSTTLPNGLKVIVKENPRLPLVSLTAALMGGTRLEGQEDWGISGFAAKMLTRGTKNRSEAEIASIVETWAGSLSAFSGRNSFGVSARFLSKDLYPGLELLSDLIRNSTFPDAELEKARGDILAAIKAKKDSPATQVFELFNQTLYERHPYGQPQSGTEESIRKLDRTELLAWYRKLAVPDNLVLSVVGDVEGESLVAHIEEIFKDFNPSSPLELPQIAPEPPLGEVRTARLQREGAQSHLVLGYLAPDIRSPENAPLALIDTALSGMGGKLFVELRDKRSLAYSVSSFRAPGLETGHFGVYIACDPNKEQVAKEEILKVIEEIREKGLTEEELASAKRYLLGNMRIGRQTNGSQAMQMALDELYGLGWTHTEEFMRAVEAVTLEDIKRVAGRILNPEKYAFVTLGPSTPAEEG
jgi:zinc protease